MSKHKTRGTDAGRQIIAALTDLAETLERGEPEEARYTVRTVEVPDAGHYDSAAVQAVRARLGASQHVFAQLLGVSRILVQSWERGVRIPAPVHRRLLDAIAAEPGRWAKKLVVREGNGLGRTPVPAGSGGAKARRA